MHYSRLALSLITSISLLSGGCASKRQIAVDYPVAKTNTLNPLPGYNTVDGDDYYVQLVSDFDFKGGSALKGGCNELGGQYDSGKLSAALVFTVSNEPLKLKRDISGFLYEATTGKCNFKLETKKSLLTPWMRLDAALKTSIDYHYFTSTSGEADFSKLMGDVSAASGLLALTGVGTGVAIIGNLSNQWLQQKSNTPATTPQLPANAKYSDESHSLQAPISLADKSVSLNQSKLAVYEVLEGGSGLTGPDQNLLGELNIYLTFSASLLLPTGSNGLPDARDLSLADLWQSPIKSEKGDISLQQLLGQVKTQEPLNLKPNWHQYAEVEGACRQLKKVLKELGFNKFDRNAVLYHFLAASEDWQNYNAPQLRNQSDQYSASQLKAMHAKGFSACLTKNDVDTMQRLGLSVNSEGDWQGILNTGEQKDSAFAPIHAVERQLLAILRNPNPAESAQQLYPLLNSGSGLGSVLLQNHLGSFGLESLLNLPALAKEGALVSAEQLSQAINALGIEKLSCVRPAPDQGKFLNNVGILLFTTKPEKNSLKGGALEFEVNSGKIVRLTLQLPSYRDFEQSIIERPSVGGCQIDLGVMHKPVQ